MEDSLVGLSPAAFPHLKNLVLGWVRHTQRAIHIPEMPQLGGEESLSELPHPKIGEKDTSVICLGHTDSVGMFSGRYCYLMGWGEGKRGVIYFILFLVNQGLESPTHRISGAELSFLCSNVACGEWKGGTGDDSQTEAVDEMKVHSRSY